MKEEEKVRLEREIQQALDNKSKVTEDLYTKSLEQLIETLKIYQRELEYQNDELVRTRDEAQRLANSYRNLFQDAPTAYLVVDENFRIQRFNKRATQILQDETNLDHRDFREFVHPVDQDLIYSTWQQIGAKKSIENVLLRLKECMVYLFADYEVDLEGNEYIKLGLIDATEEYEAKTKLAVSEMRMRGMVENAQDVIFSIDKNGNLDYLSPAWEKIMGYSLEESVGKALISFLHEDDHIDLKKRIPALFNGEKLEEQFEYTFISKDNKEVIAEVRASLLNEGGTQKLIGVGRDVTKQYHQNKELHKLGNMINSVNQAVIGVNLEHEITYWNKAAQSLFDYSYKEALGKNVFDLTVDDDHIHHAMLLNANTSNEASYQGELRSKRKDGSTFIGFVHDFTTVDEAGEPAGSIRLINDISSQKRDKYKIESLKEYKQMQLEINLEFVNSPASEYTKSISNSIEILSHYVDASTFAVAEISQETATIDWIASWHSDGERKVFPTLSIRETNYIIGEFTQNAYILTDDKHHARLFASFLECCPSIKSALVFPILSKSQLDGFMVATFKGDLPDREALDNILMSTHSFAGAIQLANTESKRISREEMFKTIAQNTSDGIAVRKGETFTFLSPAYLNILGYSESEERGFTNQDIYNLIHPLDRDPTFDYINQQIALQSETCSYQYRIKHKKGHYVWREDNTRFKYNENGTLRESYIIARDITERVNSRQKLYEQERQAKALIDALPDLVFRLDKNGYYSYFKANQSEDLYVSPEDIIGKHYKDLLPQHVAELLDYHIKILLEKGEVQMVEYSLEMPNKGTQYYEARMVLSGENEITTIVRVVTDRVERERALKTLEAAVEQSPVTVVLTNLEGDITYVNNQFCKSSGYTKEEAIGMNPRILKTGHTSKKEYEEMWETVLAGNTWQGEFLNKNKSGNKYWESVVISPVKNAEGEIFSLLAVKEDISNLKKLNAELERLSLVASKAQDSILITNGAAETEWINDSFSKLTGYTLAEVKGKIPGEYLQGKDTNPEHIQGFREGFASGKAFSQIILNYHKDGTPYWVECNITPVHDKYGNVDKYIAVEREITEMLEMQENIKNEKNLLKAIVNNLPSIVFLKNKNGARTLVNRADLDFQNINHEKDLLGKRDVDLYDPELAKLFGEQDKEIFKTGIPLENYELSVERNGEKRWFLLTKIPTKDESGNVTAILGIGKEVTEIKNREIELRDAVSVMSAQNNSLKNFAYIVSHNIRSHAANIDSLLQLMEIETDENAKEHYRTLLAEVSEKQLKTLDSLNDVIQIREATNIEKESINLNQEVSDTLKVFQADIQNHLIKVEKDIACLVDFKCHRAYFESILLNLISNSIKYRDPAKNAFVRISCKELGSNIKISIEDNGLGFDQERYSDRLFGMNQTFHKHPQARGIGLFLVKNQVLALGGKIEVESKEGKGSTFSVTLPKT